MVEFTRDGYEANGPYMAYKPKGLMKPMDLIGLISQIKLIF